MVVKAGGRFGAKRQKLKSDTAFTLSFPPVESMRMVPAQSCRIIGKDDSGLMSMKKLYLVVVVCLFATAALAQQSLGDVARANRAKKHSSSSAVKLDDDTMPRSSTPSSVAEPAKTDDKSADAKDDEGKAAPKKDTPDAGKQKNEELKKQIDAQKKEIATLQRELDIAQRESRLRAASYYGDAGTMLRDQGKYAEDTRKEQDEINTKKQALDAAQQKLSDLQEQARKSGLPSD